MTSDRIALDLSNKCPNKCTGCIRQDPDYVNNGHDMTEREMEIISDYFDIIEFCGTVSDPTANPIFLKLLQICTSKNKKVMVHVAASHQSDQWWYKACLLSKHKDVTWIFGIDGLPKDSHKYRVNQRGEILFQRMIDASKMGVKCIWQYIVFDYNQNDIEFCKKIAAIYNLEFILIRSCRYNFVNTIGKTLYANHKYLKPSGEWLSADGTEHKTLFIPKNKKMQFSKDLF